MRIHPEGRKRLAKLILIQDVRHRDLAKALGWKSHGMIGHLLAGRRTGIDGDAALRMAAFFGVDVSDLFLVDASSIPRQGKRGEAA